MKGFILKYLSASNILPIFFILFLALLVISCKNQNIRDDENVDKPGVIHIVSTAMNFELADSVYSGWNTVKYKNESTDAHFIVFEKYPAGKNIDSAKARVVSVFQEAMDSIQVDNMDAAMKTFSALPAWFGEVKYMGGTGLVSPGQTAQTTMHLSPGLYIIECYVKMPDGKFHSAMGMLEQVVVKEDNSNRLPPVSEVQIEISIDSGIIINSIPSGGQQIFKVNFKDQKQQENFVGMDVHLVRLQENQDASRLESWMDWMDPKGLVSPAPDGFEFLGGTQELPAGDSTYFTVDVSAGNYILIAEVPNASKKGLLKKFTVP